MRKLIPEEKCIVVLDTNIARYLVKNKYEPDLLDVFVEMKEHGYLFCLSDIAWAELIKQRLNDSIPAQEYEKMLSLLEKFIDMDFPMLPSTEGLTDLFFSEDDYEFDFKHAWEQLRTLEDKQMLEKNLEEVKNGWLAYFSQCSKDPEIPSLLKSLRNDDPQLCQSFATRFNHYNCVPPMHIRMDLELKYYTQQAINVANTCINPCSKKRENDGLDVLLLHYLILPAFLLTEDKIFSSDKLQSIQSFQKEWILNPKKLAMKWCSGEEPRPVWPSTKY